MLRHYYNQFLFILQFSVNFSSLYSLFGPHCCCLNIMMMCLFCGNFGDPFLRSSVHERCNLSSGQKKKIRSRPTFGLNVNDVLKSCLNCDGLALSFLQVHLIIFPENAETKIKFQEIF